MSHPSSTIIALTAVMITNVILSGCVKPEGALTTLHAVSVDAPPVPAACTTELFTLHVMHADHPATDFGFVNDDYDVLYPDNHRYVLNVCETADGTLLLSHVYSWQSGGNFEPIIEHWVPGEGDTVTGLDAIFGTDVSALKIMIKNPEYPGVSLQVRGWIKDGVPLVTVNNFAWGSDPMHLDAPLVKVGKLVLVEPGNQDSLCTVGRHIIQRFVADTVEIALDYCYVADHQTLGTAIAQEFKQMTIKDTSSQLAAPIDQTLSGEALAAALTDKDTHHGGSDSYTIRLAGVEYYIGPATSGSDYVFRRTYRHAVPITKVLGECLVYSCGDVETAD